MNTWFLLQDAVSPAPAGWLDHKLLGNTVLRWLIAGGLLLALLLIFAFITKAFRLRLVGMAKKTSTKLDDLTVEILGDFRWWLITAVALYAAAQPLALSPVVDQILWTGLVVAAALQALVTSRLVLDYSVNAVAEHNKTPDGQPDPSIITASGIIRSLFMLALGSVLVLVVLANLGIKITPLITGLGIGGIAVALAAQSILGDLFGSLTILFDKPFLVGDFIIVGDKMGTVERIGIKTTRVRALAGEQLVFSNTDLLTSRVQNFKRMQERRIVFTLGVVYETPLEKLQRIPDLISQAVLAQDLTRFDRAHFKSFGAYSLDFEVVYFVTSPDFKQYMDVQQAINFGLVRRFADEGIQFAYPTHVEIYRPASPTDPTPPSRK